jgi:magnesium-transporting ATPase (P-type)
MWINLFQDTLAALALATDPPQPRVLGRAPEAKMAPLITVQMWKTIVGQSVYQIAVTLVLYFAGGSIFTSWGDQMTTLVFNTYVWLQIFNMYKYVACLETLDGCFPLTPGRDPNPFSSTISLQFLSSKAVLTPHTVAGSTITRSTSSKGC